VCLAGMRTEFNQGVVGADRVCGLKHWVIVLAENVVKNTTDKHTAGRTVETFAPLRRRRSSLRLEKPPFSLPMACSERTRRRGSWQLQLRLSYVVHSGLTKGPMTHAEYFIPLSPSKYCPSDKYICG